MDLRYFRIVNGDINSGADGHRVRPGPTSYMDRTRYLCFLHGNWRTTESLIRRHVVSNALTFEEQSKADLDALNGLLGAVAKRNRGRV